MTYRSLKKRNNLKVKFLELAMLCQVAAVLLLVLCTIAVINQPLSRRHRSPVLRVAPCLAHPVPPDRPVCPVCQVSLVPLVRLARSASRAEDRMVGAELSCVSGDDLLDICCCMCSPDDLPSGTHVAIPRR